MYLCTCLLLSIVLHIHTQFLETGSHLAQADLEIMMYLIMILLLPPPECWNYQCVPLCSVYAASCLPDHHTTELHTQPLTTFVLCVHVCKCMLMCVQVLVETSVIPKALSTLVFETASHSDLGHSA